MKLKAIYLLLPVALLASACLKEPNTPTETPNYPLGAFAGKFTRIHLNKATSKTDTAYATIQLAMSSSTGFAVTGDTATVHAGSKGGFGGTVSEIGFNDITWGSPVSKNKTHLHGTYSYTFNGTILQINGMSGDTLSYRYDLTKISN